MKYGQDIVRRVYERLRKPSQQSLPYQTVLSTVAEVVARKKLDLALSSQNSSATTSQWFTPTTADFGLQGVGLDGILLPIRVERRGIDSDYETGEEVPIVNYEVLNTSNVGAISFYGDPLRMVFRDTLDYITQQQYRVVYESDLATADGRVTLSSVVGLPDFFAGMVVLESIWELIDLVEDTSDEWLAFYKMISPKLEKQIIDKRDGWDRYVRLFKGKAAVPKRTFWDNRRCGAPTRFFKG
jgi:hypothetical protein